MPDSLATINLRSTPQTSPAKPEQVVNHAGGYVFEVDPFTALRRFLVLGVAGGTFYASEAKHTVETAKPLIELARTAAGERVVAEIVEISTAGRAPKPNPALFMLAAVMGVGDEAARKAAYDALPKVVRTGTHLFTFVGYVEQFRGWGPALRRAVSQWYTDKDIDPLGYQVAKYQSREGWTHRDVLRLAHPKARDDRQRALFDYICGRYTPAADEVGFLPKVIHDVSAAHTAGTDVAELVKSVGSSLSWEMLPSESLNDVKVWEALLANGLPMTALIRQLPRLTKLGLTKPMSTGLDMIIETLGNQEKLVKSRVHPLSVLVALKTYASGTSVRGEGVWEPSGDVIDALDKAFYASFGNVRPSGKRTLLAVDVSGSMGWGNIAGLPITPREASAALALVTAATESKTYVTAFSHNLVNLPISPRQRMNDVLKVVDSVPMGGTDCSLPMITATQQKLEVDTFVVITDNETYAGRVHPFQALREYRASSGINAKLVVVGMTAASFSIADPSDAGMLDVAGFDTATPQLIADFSAGLI